MEDSYDIWGLWLALALAGLSLIGACLFATVIFARTIRRVLRTFRAGRRGQLNCVSERAASLPEYDTQHPPYGEYSDDFSDSLSASGFGFLLVLPATVVGHLYIPNWFLAFLLACVVASALATGVHLASAWASRRVDRWLDDRLKAANPSHRYGHGVCAKCGDSIQGTNESYERAVPGEPEPDWGGGSGMDESDYGPPSHDPGYNP